MLKRVVSVLTIAALAAAGWWLLGGISTDAESLRSLRSELEDHVYRAPLQSALIFIVAYWVVAALALPGALILTLLGGALFGLGLGALLVALGSSLGALLSFTVVRLIAGQALRDRLAARLATVARGIEADGGFYVFTLRVMPVFPFFLVNVLLALTPLRAWTFYWVSVIGMLPATLIYVNAGHQLATLTSIGDILSPPLLMSLVVLAVFPLIARKVLPLMAQRFRVAAAQRASRRRWQRPTRFDRDLIVIGAGAAGLVAANIASTLRARVTLIEREAMGGDCLNTGCVPSKALIRIAERVQLARDLARQGLVANGAGDQWRAPDFRLMMAQVRDTIDRIAPHDSVERYESLGVECLRGEAQAVSPWTVEVRTGNASEPRVLHARHLIIATGAEPVVPEIPGLARQHILTTQTLWSIDALPARLLILGGGAVGCEMAQAFRRLGSTVCVVERAERLLAREEPEASAEVLKAFIDDGIQVLLKAELARVESVDRAHVAHINVNGRQEQIAFDQLLCALGRRARVDGAGLESLGLARLPDGTLQVDEWMRTSEPSVFACGDVATTDRLTHAAGQMGWHAAVNALFGDLWPIRIDRSALPRCTFTDPAVARVGPTRDEAERAGYRVDCTRVPLNTLDRAIIDRQTRGFVMVLTERGSDRLLGATVVGAHADDLIALFALAIRERIGMRRLMSSIIAYPGWADASRAVAAQWQRERAPEALLTWLARWHRWRRG